MSGAPLMVSESLLVALRTDAKLTKLIESGHFQTQKRAKTCENASIEFDAREAKMLYYKCSDIKHVVENMDPDDLTLHEYVDLLRASLELAEQKLSGIQFNTTALHEKIVYLEDYKRDMGRRFDTTFSALQEQTKQSNTISKRLRAVETKLAEARHALELERLQQRHHSAEDVEKRFEAKLDEEKEKRRKLRRSFISLRSNLIQQREQLSQPINTSLEEMVNLFKE